MWAWLLVAMGSFLRPEERHEENGARLGIRKDGESGYRGEIRPKIWPETIRVRRHGAWESGVGCGELIRELIRELRGSSGDRRCNGRWGEEGSWASVECSVVFTAARLPGGRYREPWKRWASCGGMDIVRALIWRDRDARSLGRCARDIWSSCGDIRSPCGDIREEEKIWCGLHREKTRRRSLGSGVLGGWSGITCITVTAIWA